MISDLASLPLTMITSGVVSSLVIYLTKSWITERLKRAIEHEYAQKLEAHRAALKSDYDVQLERLRAENAKQLAIEASARSSLADAYKAAHERRLRAIEQAWEIILKIRSACTPAFLFLDILHDEEQETVPSNTTFRANIKSSIADPLDKRLFSASKGMDEIRLFVGDHIYAFLFVYRAIHGRIEMRMQKSLETGHLDPWWKDAENHRLLLLVLSQTELEELQQHGQYFRFNRLRLMLETKLLQEFQPIISGEAAAHFSLEQAMAIHSAAVQSRVSSQSLM
jgi:hypothetical protein